MSIKPQSSDQRPLDGRRESRRRTLHTYRMRQLPVVIETRDLSLGCEVWFAAKLRDCIKASRIFDLIGLEDAEASTILIRIRGSAGVRLLKFPEVTAIWQNRGCYRAFPSRRWKILRVENRSARWATFSKRQWHAENQRCRSRGYEGQNKLPIDVLNKRSIS